MENIGIEVKAPLFFKESWVTALLLALYPVCPLGQCLLLACGFMLQNESIIYDLVTFGFCRQILS
jgi:hypothetical protein